MATPKDLEFNLCGSQQLYEPFVPAICKRCDSQWLEACYDCHCRARDVTPEERKRLNGHIEAVYQKGSLPTRKFVDQVLNVIEEANEE